MEGVIYGLLMSTLFLTCSAAGFEINECGISGRVEIVKTTPQPSLTCSGLNPAFKMFWSENILGVSNQYTISNCLKDGSQSCGECLCPDSLNHKDKFNVTLSADGTESTLYFNDLQFSQNRTFYCRQNSSKGCTVLFIDAQYKLNECQKNSTDVVVNQDRNITCSGMDSTHNMYWVLAFMNGTKSRIDCSATTIFTACNPSGPDVKAFRDPDWSVLTVQDRNRSLDGTNVTCSQLFNQTKDQCQINVILPYQLLECQNNSMEIVQNRARTITCSRGSENSRGVYWTVASKNNLVMRTDCPECAEASCYCSSVVTEGGYLAVNAENGLSNLTLMDNFGDLDGATVTCSHLYNVTQDQCHVKVIPPPYTLDECQNNSTAVIVNQDRNITCSGMTSGQNIYWIIAFKNGTDIRIDCSAAGGNFTCNQTVPDVEAFRDPNWSVLTVQDRNRSQDGAVVTCSQKNNAMKDQCQINVIPRLQECKNDVIEVIANHTRNFTCYVGTSPLPLNLTLSLTVALKNETEWKIECPEDNLIDGCRPYPADLKMHRSLEAVVMTVQDRNRDLDKANVTCSLGDSAQHRCQVQSVPRLQECKNNVIEVVANHTRNFTCYVGISPPQLNLTLTVDLNNGTTWRIECPEDNLTDGCTPFPTYLKIYRSTEAVVMTVQDHNRTLDGANVTCMLGNISQHQCQVQVASPYQIAECKSGKLDMRENGQTNLTCTGQESRDSWHWAVSVANTIVAKAECSGGNCGNCSGSFCGVNNVTVVGSHQLALKDKGRKLDGAFVTCYRQDNFTMDLCQVNAVPLYKLKECQNHATSMPENGSGVLTLTCENLLPMEDMYWTVRYANGTTLRIDCLQNKTACETRDGEVYVVRGFFNIQDKNRELDGAVFTCSSADNVTSDHCKIIYDNQPSASAFPIVAVAAGGGGGALIIIIIIIVVIIVRKRGSRRQGNKTKGVTRLVEVDTLAAAEHRMSDEMVEIINDGYISADCLDENGAIKVPASAATNGTQQHPPGTATSSATAAEAAAANDRPLSEESETYYSQTAGDKNDAYTSVDDYSYARTGDVQNQAAENQTSGGAQNVGKRTVSDEYAVVKKPKGDKPAQFEMHEKNETEQGGGTNSADYYNVTPLSMGNNSVQNGAAGTDVNDDYNTLFQKKESSDSDYSHLNQF